MFETAAAEAVARDDAGVEILRRAKSARLRMTNPISLVVEVSCKPHPSRAKGAAPKNKPKTHIQKTNVGHPRGGWARFSALIRDIKFTNLGLRR